jgi:hypothetical protein
MLTQTKSRLHFRLQFGRYLLAVTGAFVVTLAHGSAAQGRVLMGPPVQEIQLRRGGAAQFGLLITNKERGPISVSLTAQDLGMSEEGVVYGDRAGTPRGCGKWITISPTSFTLAVDESRKVRCVLRAPRDATGGHYAVIEARLEPVDRGPGAEATPGLTMHYQMNAVVMAVVMSARLKPELVPLDLILSRGRSEPTSGKAQGWSAACVVSNRGNVHLPLSGSILVRDGQGRIVARSEFPTGRVLPGYPRRFTVSGPEALGDGSYVVEATLFPPDRARPIVMRRACSVNPKGVTMAGSATASVQQGPVFGLGADVLFVEAPRGARRVLVLAVRNNSGGTLPLTARVVRLAPGGAAVHPDGPPAERNCEAWLSLDRAKLQLPGSGSAQLRVSASIPRNANGEYYAALVVRTAGSPEYQCTVPVYVRAAGTAKAAASVLLSGDVARSGATRFIVQVINTGNVRCAAGGSIDLRDRNDNRVTDAIPFGSELADLLPGQQKTVVVACPAVLKGGQYTATASLNYAKGHPPALARASVQAK